jgi:signal transduction histidine kinase
MRDKSRALESVDVSHLVGEMFNCWSVSKSAVLKSISRETPTVAANPAQIRQVVMNLITNASDAIEEKQGVITVATSKVRLDGDVR